MYVQCTSSAHVQLKQVVEYKMDSKVANCNLHGRVSWKVSQLLCLRIGIYNSLWVECNFKSMWKFQFAWIKCGLYSRTEILSFSPPFNSTLGFYTVECPLTRVCVCAHDLSHVIGTFISKLFIKKERTCELVYYFLKALVMKKGIYS